MKRMSVSLILAIVMILTTVYAFPALAAGVTTPVLQSAALSVKSDRWVTLSVRWTAVSGANAGYEMVVIKSNGQSKTFYYAVGVTSAKLTLTNDDFTVKLRAVRKSASGVKSYSAYAAKDVARVAPKLTLPKGFVALQPGQVAQLRVTAVPQSDVSFSVADSGVATVSASGTVTGRRHGSTTVTVRSGTSAVTARVYVSFATGQIQAVCSEKGYVSGAYWSYSKSAGNSEAYTASPFKATTATATSRNRPGDGDYVGYAFDWASECMGFAHYIGYKISNVQPKLGWTKFESIAAVKAEGGLQIGDILRTTGHSAIVYDILSDGTFTVAEAWGGSNNLIKVGGRFAGTYSYTTLDAIPGFVYVYRFKG